MTLLLPSSFSLALGLSLNLLFIRLNDLLRGFCPLLHPHLIGVIILDVIRKHLYSSILAGALLLHFFELTCMRSLQVYRLLIQIGLSPSIFFD